MAKEQTKIVAANIQVKAIKTQPITDVVKVMNGAHKRPKEIR
jgi:hypothetical protein